MAVPGFPLVLTESPSAAFAARSLRPDEIVTSHSGDKRTEERKGSGERERKRERYRRGRTCQTTLTATKGYTAERAEQRPLHSRPAVAETRYSRRPPTGELFPAGGDSVAFGRDGDDSSQRWRLRRSVELFRFSAKRSSDSRSFAAIVYR